MEKFIRLDIKGTWKGTEHQSRTASWFYEEDDRYLENGISCYYANVNGIEDLFYYWSEHTNLSYKDLKKRQLTVFEGQHSGTGRDMEELAWCESTIKELEAYDWYKSIEKAKEMADIDEDGEYYDNDKDDYFKGLTQEEYEEVILKATGLK